VTDENGCHFTEDATIILRNALLKAAINGPDVVCPKETTLFSDSSIGAITNWNWDFSNGSVSALQNPGPQQYPPNGAFFTVRLSVTDSAGCVQESKKVIRSVDNCYIAVPNAFTPNGDGLNDFLYPLNAYKATNLRFIVFDRWGRVVFETT